MYLGRDQQISEGAVTKFYHNLSMQALSKSNSKIALDFTRISELVKNINSNLQKIIYKHKKIKQDVEI